MLTDRRTGDSIWC